MIIDSHAHYNNNAYKKPFRYLSYDKDGYSLKEGELPQLMQEMDDADIRYFIEPGVIAIGEIGLDYHYKREEQHRLKQHIWFIYQLNLAWKLKLPVILHVRDAHEDALRILRWHPARKLGGVIHCFYGSKEIAEQYLKLGYHFGIGGSVLQLEERANNLWEAIPSIPLDRILLETDAPFILPYCKDVIQPKLLRRARNTSLILPAVIKKIAELKGISADEVEQATTENTIRLFSLPIEND